MVPWEQEDKGDAGRRIQGWEQEPDGEIARRASKSSISPEIFLAKT